MSDAALATRSMTREDILARARKLTDSASGAASYDVANDDQDVCEAYSLLVGPGGFRCFLGEPEDSTWSRDGSDAVDRLNDLNDTIRDLLTLLPQETTP